MLEVGQRAGTAFSYERAKERWQQRVCVCESAWVSSSPAHPDYLAAVLIVSLVLIHWNPEKQTASPGFPHSLLLYGVIITTQSLFTLITTVFSRNAFKIKITLLLFIFLTTFIITTIELKLYNDILSSNAALQSQWDLTLRGSGSSAWWVLLSGFLTSAPKAVVSQSSCALNTQYLFIVIFCAAYFNVLLH